MAENHHVTVGILGPLEVRVGGVSVRVPSLQQRVILARLAMCANEVVSRDSLIDAVWGERPPATAEKALQVHVSHLRKLLEPRGTAATDAQVLITRAPGYLLRVGDEQVDSGRFERLVESGTAALSRGACDEATDRLREGLDLWRGPPLGDLADEEFAQPEVRRLEELRLAALEARIDADLTLGAPGLVGELEALVHEHPLRERLRSQLMLCLYRSGRQAEALELYQATRHAMVEELGIEPGRRLRDLHQAILEQDPALDLPVGVASAESPAAPGTPEEGVPLAVPAALSPEGSGPFVGRTADVAWLLERWEHSRDGQRRLVLVGGEPGIGKTRLAGELARLLHLREAAVLYGRSDPEGLIPYQPFVEALEHYVAAAPLGQLRRALGTSGGELRRLIPAVGHRLPDLPLPGSGDAEGQRYRLFEAVSRLLSEASRTTPALLVLDDLHWADPPTVLLLKHLVRDAASPLMILGTYRDSELERTHPLTQALPSLRRERGCERLALGGLDTEDVAQLIAEVSGQTAPPELTQAVWAESDGNPLFVEEVVLHLGELGVVERGMDWTAPGSLEELGVPEGLTEVIGQRLGRLSERTSRILTIASVIGRAFDVEVLEALAVAPGDALLESLEEAIRARVVAEEASAVGRYAFAHALIREAVYQDLTRTRRVSLHRQIGLALEALYPDRPARLAELAYHFHRAAPAGDVDRAVKYGRRAGDHALRLLAYEEAARLYGMALKALDMTEDADQSVRCELLLALGDAQARAGDGSAAKQSFLDAARLAAVEGMSEALGRAALGYGGRFVWARAEDRNLVALLEEALAALSDEDSELRARLLARLAGALRDEPARDRRARLSREAIAIARRLGDPATLAYTLGGGYAADWGPENHAERLVVVSEFVRLAEQAGAEERAMEGHNFWLFALLEVGDMPSMRRELDHVAAVATKLRQPAQLWYLATIRAMLALLEGRFDAAATLMDEALELGRRAQSWEAGIYHGLQVFSLAAARGRLEEVEQRMRGLVGEYPSYRVCRCALASLHAQLEREAEARTVFESFAMTDFTELAFDEEWLYGMTLLSETCSFLDDRARAEQLYALLLPYGDRVAVSVPDVCTGSVERYLGILATTLGRLDAAAGHFEAARERNAAMGARPWLAHTEHDHAQALIARAKPGDDANALELLTQCIDRYEELGMDAWAQKASVLRTQVGG